MRIPLLNRVITIKKEQRGAHGDLNVDNPEHWARVMGRSAYDSTAGVDVNPDNALKATAVFACIRVLAFSLAQLPLITYKRLERGKERAIDHPVYELLHNQPNPEINSFHWRATKMAQALLYGNAYSEIEFNGAGKPIGLWLIPAWRCKPTRVNTEKQKNLLVYEVQSPDGSSKLLLPQQVLHIKGLGTDGFVGLSVIRQAAQAIGISLASQEFAARFFGQGMTVSGVLEHPGHLNDEAFERLKRSFEEKYSGLSKTHRMMLLEEGMKFNKTSIPPEEAQFLETRQFEVTDIARMFGVPPHLIADLTRATFSNIEQQSIEFVTHTMMPWLVNWEQELNTKLLGGDREYFAEFLIEGLLRGDSQSRALFYKELFMMAALSPNDIREKENMNPVEHGDSYFMPLNMMPVFSDGQPITIPQLESKRKEQRKGLALVRYRVANSYRQVFEDAGKRIVGREVKDLRREIKKHLEERATDTFRSYLADFYRDFPEFIAKQIKPAVHALSEAIMPLAQDEVGRTTGNPQLDKFLEEYSKTFAYRYAQSSQGQLIALLNKEIVDWDEIDTRLDEWEERRPGKISINETIQLSNAVAKVVFAGAGIQMLVWRNTSAKSCPYCEEMDGRTVGIDQDFLSAKSRLEVEGEGTMQIYRPTSQPPLHEGCQCQLEPG